MIQSHFRQQPLEPEPPLCRGAAQSLIFVDDLDLLGSPAEINCSVNQGILAIGGLSMFDHLRWGRLPDVDDGSPFHMTSLDLGRSETQTVVRMVNSGGSQGFFSDR